MEPGDLLGAVHDAVYALLLKHGADELAAIADTQALCAQLQKNFGGREHYLPALDKTARHRKILADLQEGLDPQAVADRHGVTLKTVHNAKRAATHEKSGPNDPGLGREDWVIR